jgi:hypothetical protein
LTAIDRKAAIDAYKRRKIVGGVYGVICGPTGQRWVGAANELGAMKNRIWFTLNHGSASWVELQKAWKTHGAEAFTFEELERLDDDLEPYAKELALKARLEHWLQKLGATAI